MDTIATEESVPHHIDRETTEPVARLASLDERLELRVHVDTFNALADALGACARGVDFFWSHGGEGDGDEDVATALRDAARSIEDAVRVLSSLIETRFPGQTEASR